MTDDTIDPSASYYYYYLPFIQLKYESSKRKPRKEKSKNEEEIYDEGRFNEAETGLSFKTRSQSK